MADDENDLAFVSTHHAVHSFFVIVIRVIGIDWNRQGIRDRLSRFHRAPVWRRVNRVNARNDIGVGKLPREFRGTHLPCGRQSRIVNGNQCFFGMPDEDHRRGRLRLEEPGKADGDGRIDNDRLYSAAATLPASVRLCISA